SSGLDLIKDLHIRWPKVAVLVVSMRDEGVYAERSLRAGAQGYIVKTEAVGEIAHAVREVLKGNLFLSRSMANKMLCKFVEGKSATERSVVECLTNRELQVLELLGGGLATWQVAQQLHVSTKTVATYRENIKRKMHLDDATDLLRFAIQWVHCPNENELRA
ncbi:MAG: response regulator transcription factor, partial [Planctomycetota bacterium]|nr:response regulator transcription factor [Planctomycetota bacterium]